MIKIGVLGTGTWAMALSNVLLKNSHDIIMWGRDKTQINALNKTGLNPKYELGIKLTGNIEFTTDLDKLKNSEIILNVIPTQFTRSIFSKLEEIDEKTIIVNASKGIEISSLKTISEIIFETNPKNKFVVLSGPSHAEELAKFLPTTLVSASKCLDSAKKIQNIFSMDKLRVYTNDDVLGIELSAASKNVIAFASGISDGMGNGDNAKAALMTRGMAEIKRLAYKMGAKPATFDGLAGIGDLIVTCTSIHSRNRRCGILVGKGLSIEEALDEIGMVVEGVSTVKACYELSKIHDVDMPITKGLFKILYEKMCPFDLLDSLMTRELKSERQKYGDT